MLIYNAVQRNVHEKDTHTHRRRKFKNTTLCECCAHL